jgi:hypothetical protein
MITTVFLAAVGFSAVDFPNHVDLFLIANNPVRLESPEAIDKLRNADRTAQLLQPIISQLSNSNTPFLLVDGGRASRFVSVDPLETSYIGGSVHGMSWGRILSKPFVNGKCLDHSAAVFWYPDAGSNQDPAALQDQTSVALIKKSLKDDSTVNQTIEISSASVLRSAQVDFENGFKGLCICATGNETPEAPNHISFPPRGVVGHYALYKRDGVWHADLLGYLF